MRQTVRRSLTVRLLGGGRPPVATADLNGSPSSGMLSQTPVNGRTGHSSNAHQLTDFYALVRSHAEREPKRLLGCHLIVIDRIRHICCWSWIERRRTRFIRRIDCAARLLVQLWTVA